MNTYIYIYINRYRLIQEEAEVQETLERNRSSSDVSRFFLTGLGPSLPSEEPSTFHRHICVLTWRDLTLQTIRK